MGAKWFELLKQIAPGVTRVAVLRTQGSGTSQFAAIQTAAPSLRMEVNPINMRDAGAAVPEMSTLLRLPETAGERPLWLAEDAVR
jgi:putative tryptophan/tyrosine transport system substrate-binding protein